MASYIALGTFTDQGARTVKDTSKRADAVRDMAGRFGVTVKSIHWTLGQYDVVTFCDAQDEASINCLFTGGRFRRQCPAANAQGIYQGRYGGGSSQAALTPERGAAASVVLRRGRDFPVLQHPVVAVHAFQPHPEAPEPRHVLDHLFGAVVQRPVVVAGVAQRE